MFLGIYNNKNVLVTGHTGFKGSWLSLWLKKMGANVIGYSLDPPTSPNHFQLLNLEINSIKGDVRDLQKLKNTIKEFKPEIVFHLAAQSLVRESYDNPIETYETNVIGTLKVFEACKSSSVKAIVNITSDKAYENIENIKGYKEIDAMGGYDPYSSSKGCSELLTASFRNSYFNIDEYQTKHNVLLASCRAGNVIGGGDWAKDRLISDIMISVAHNKKVKIRSPNAIRPWQHVLEPLSGYLLIGQKLLEGCSNYAEAWNFGPAAKQCITVEQVLKNVKIYWDKIDYTINTNDNLHEANILTLDCNKALRELKWEPVWDSNKTFKYTVEWYENYYELGKTKSDNDLRSYIKCATEQKLVWAK